jgi:nucleoid-associated protein YgaU
MTDKPRPEDGEPEDLSAVDPVKRTRPAASRPARPASPGGAPRPLAPLGAARPADEPSAQFIAEHTLAADETLSHLALKYYGHATPPYWKLIYEANKALIGDNPNRVRPGMALKIPALPEDMK